MVDIEKVQKHTEGMRRGFMWLGILYIVAGILYTLAGLSGNDGSGAIFIQVLVVLALGVLLLVANSQIKNKGDSALTFARIGSVVLFFFLPPIGLIIGIIYLVRLSKPEYQDALKPTTSPPV